MGNVKISKVKIVAWSIALRRLIIILQKKSFISDARFFVLSDFNVVTVL